MDPANILLFSWRWRQGVGPGFPESSWKGDREKKVGWEE